MKSEQDFPTRAHYRQYLTEYYTGQIIAQVDIYKPLIAEEMDNLIVRARTYALALTNRMFQD